MEKSCKNPSPRPWFTTCKKTCLITDWIWIWTLKCTNGKMWDSPPVLSPVWVGYRSPRLFVSMTARTPWVPCIVTCRKGQKLLCRLAMTILALPGTQSVFFLQGLYDETWTFFSLRWNVSEFSSCSKSCGGGIQTRSVTCIQEVRHGGNNILRVDDSFCPQPPPITQQFCSVVDCPVMWKTGPWSKVRNHQNLICYYFLMSITFYSAPKNAAADTKFATSFVSNLWL